MPGLFGIYNRKAPSQKDEIKKGISNLQYTDAHQINQHFFDERLNAASVPFSSQNPNVSDESFCFWFDGEIYSWEEKIIYPRFKEGVKNQNLPKILSEVDGYYSACLYNRIDKSILWATDRYGIKPLYFYKDDQRLVWSSEIKAILSLENIDLTLDKEGIDDYLELGMMRDNRTWFKNITLASPASIYTLDVDGWMLNQKHYWTWKSLDYNQKISFDDAVSETARLLRRAVQKRVFENESTTIALSGGLDSRALLSLCSEPKNITAFTFGKPSAQDFQLAQEVASVLGAKHVPFEANASNWLHDKIFSTWKTEGFMPFVHMHSSPFCRQFPALGSSVLNGFGGATLMGGLFLKSPLEKRIKRSPSKHEASQDDYTDTRCPESSVISLHMRRFINQGSIDMGKYLYQKKPYMDHDLLDFVLTLPLAFRKNHRLFHSVLRTILKKELLDLPWENTGIKITNAFRTRTALKIKWPAIRRKLGLRRAIFDYKIWIKTSQSQEFIHRFLGSKNNLMTQMLGDDYRIDTNDSDLQKIGRYLSAEIWLQLVFNNLDIHEGPSFI